MTSKARYEASRVLHSQHLWSQWTLTFLAVGQILLTLVTALDLYDHCISNDLINFMTALFAIIVLAYSLLLGMSNFQLRANQVHKCGIELSGIAKKIRFYIGNQPIAYQNYEILVKEYNDCLKGYENHSSRDYFAARLHHGEEFEKCKISNMEVVCLIIKIWRGNMCLYWHYLASMFALIIWMWFLVDI